MKKEKIKKVKKTSIGGQAVLEGIMMRGRSAEATAVRDADGIIRLETERITPPEKRNFFLKLPIVRGVYAFIQSMIGGTKTLMRSAEVYGEGEPSKAETWIAEKLKINVMSVVSAISLVLGLVLAVTLFVYLPVTVKGLIENLIGDGFRFGVWAKNFIEGGLKLLIFLGYICFCLLFKDIRRVFMYHGAEHKTISCYEKGIDLTVENARKCSRVHNRCGTTFIVFVLLISILFFACFESVLEVNEISLVKWQRVLLKVAFLPIVAGLSYELLKGLAKTECFIFFPLKVPGLLLQRLTTREPSDDMLEVAITAFKKVIEMDEDQSIPTVKFIVAKKRKELTEEVKTLLEEKGITEVAESEWIVSLTLNIKRDQVYTNDMVNPREVEKVLKLANERAMGRPLWYCVGDTVFYGYTIKVDERVLIPRPETELVVENAIKCINKESKVLDLCSGSGAIAIAVQKETGATVTAVDVSQDAIELAKENAILNSADIEFIKSDLFNELENRKFNVIISNPPYIKSADISTLQKEVKEFEPVLALDGGEDGLDFYRNICSKAKDYLTEDGVLIFECGIGQANIIKDMLADCSSVEIIKDYENIERIVKAVF